RAAEMHTAARLADALDQARFERAVHVLVGELDAPFARRVLLRERLEPGADRAAVLGGDEALLLEHPGMGDRRAHVVLDEPLVEQVILARREAQDALVEGQALVPQPSHGGARCRSRLLLRRAQVL